MSNIPRARDLILEVTATLDEQGDHEVAEQLRAAIALMVRRSAARRAPAHSAEVTESVRAEIIALAADTDLHSSEIAARVGVNPGRVSEVLHGDR